MVIRNNVAGLRAYNANRKTVRELKKNLEKLSSGYRINRAADDAAGLGVSERIHAKVTELDRAQTNAEEGMDLARTADAALQEVNDMLKRARGLCIQAENGTYSDQELAAISDEMNELFSEIDRISAGSYHNSICLFRQGVGHTYHEEYDESFNPTGDDNLQVWGQMDFIETKDFEEAEDAIPAKVTFELSDDIDLNDVSSLNSTVLRIGDGSYYGTRTYFFGDSPTNLPSSYYEVQVPLGGTVEQAMQNLANRSGYAVSLDKDARTVTMTAPLKDWQYTMYDYVEIAANGDGDYANGTKVYFPEDTGSLGTVTVDTTKAYSSPVTMAYTFPPAGKSGTDTLADVWADLQHNTFNLQKRVGPSTNSYSSVLSVPLADVATASTTWDDLGNTLVNKINGIPGGSYKAEYSGGKINITHTPTTTSSPTSLKVSIGTGVKVPGNPGTISKPEVSAKDLKTWNSTGINFTVGTVQEEAGEAREVRTLEVGPVTDFPCSYSVNGTAHLYYNSKDSEYDAVLKSEEGTKGSNPSYLVTSTSYYNTHDVTSITSEQIAANIESAIKSKFSSASYTVTRVGNKFTIAAKGKNTTIKSTLESMFKPTTCTITAHRPYTPPEYTGGTTAILSNAVLYSGTTSTAQTMDQTTTVELGAEADINNLQGKCFYVGGHYFEFTNSADAEGGNKYSNYIDIDLSSRDTHEKIKDFVASELGNSYNLTVDGNNLKITSTNSFSASSRPVVGIKQLL